MKNTKFNTLKTKVNELDKKIPDGTTLIHIYQYNTGKYNFEKKNGDVHKNILDVSGLVTAAVRNSKISEVENKTPVVTDLAKITDYDARILETEGNYFTTSYYNKFTSHILDAKIKQKKN